MLTHSKNLRIIVFWLIHTGRDRPNHHRLRWKGSQQITRIGIEG